MYSECTSSADGSAAVVDLSVKFEGQTSALYVVTAAAASSAVNGSESLLVFSKSQPAKHPDLPKQQQVTWSGLYRSQRQICLGKWEGILS